MFMTAPISAAAVVAGVVLLALAVAATYGNWRGGGVRRGYWAALVSLRILMIAVILLLVLQPASQLRKPDPERFRVAILADVSGSMSTADCQGGQARLAVVQRALGADAGAWMQAVRHTYNTQTYSFAETLVRQTPDMPVRIQAGATALGNVLRQCLELHADLPLGAVVVLSDGQSNAGALPPEVAKLYQQRGIPISCVGIGAAGDAGDVEVRFLSSEVSTEKGHASTAQLLVRNTLPTVAVITVDVSLGSRPVFSEDLVLAAGAETVLAVPVQPWRAGFLSCRAALRQPVPGDNRPETDVDYLGVRVQEPDSFRVLYLGGHLGWEYRAIAQALAASRQLQLAAIIQTSPSSYYTKQLDNEPDAAANATALTGLPETAAQLNEYDAILLDTRLLDELAEAVVVGLQAFVEKRGGGLLMFGPAEALPEPLVALLPAPAAPQQASWPRDTVLQASRAFIFERDPARALTTPPPLLLSAHDNAELLAKLKPGARAALSVAGSDAAVLAAQTYGSGRSAYLGAVDTWRWRLGSSAGLEQHTQFWRELLLWLAASSRQRLEPLFDGHKINRDEPAVLALDVLDADYSPAAQVRGRCTITAPTGGSEVVEVTPHPKQIGRYLAAFHPDQAGEYRIALEVHVDGQRLEKQAHLLVRSGGSEYSEPHYNEKTLRDIARITGGGFVSYKQLGQAGALPLNANLPVRATTHYWCNNVLMLALALATLSAVWYLRRRIGLK